MGRRRRGRVPRRPVVLGLVVVGVVGALLIVALQARPSASSSLGLGLERAYVGTTYAFDGAVCLRSSTVAARVLSVEVEQGAGSMTRLVRPPDGARVTVGFPVQDGGGDVAGYRVSAGQDDCTLRLLVTPTQKGAVRAGTVRVRTAYGPFGLLRRTASVRPQVRLDVTGEGADPRASGSAQ